MITKMKFLSITGPKDDIDRVAEEYLSRYDIQLENALTELKTVHDLHPFIEENPYLEYQQTAAGFAALLASDPPADDAPLPAAGEAMQLVDIFAEKTKALEEKKQALLEEQECLSASLQNIEHFKGLDYDISAILHFRFIKFRFGKMSVEHYEKFMNYVYDNLDTIFLKCQSDEHFVWGLYFVPAGAADEIDAMYASLHFERFYLPDEYHGTPAQAHDRLAKHLDQLAEKLSAVDDEISALLEENKTDLILAAKKLQILSDNFDIRKLAACTREHHEIFYILLGWMPKKEAARFQKEIEKDENIHAIIADDITDNVSLPPTKLSNPVFLKPFEFFVKMYGLPAYNEIDPTLFLALTYTFIFGVMFGDAGQGLCLIVGGFLLYKWKKIDLAAIIGYAGIFSTLFGLLYGSFFGFEDVLPALWLSPAVHMSNLPFIGKLNTIFIAAIAFGMLIILITMILHIINGFKAKDRISSVFDTNGLCGLVFYGLLVLVILLFMNGKHLPAAGILAVFFGLPLLLIACKEPISHMLGKHKETSEGIVMFIVQTFFELFEILLTFFSNTLSFVRMGAFAVSHAAMMEVVLMLAGAEKGTINWLVIILGNLFVCGMEGLIVGIQVLRLSYYEMFSRFYKGNGRAFRPYRQKQI